MTASPQTKPLGAIRFPNRDRVTGHKMSRAFTLLEILVVLAIIGMLVGLGVTNLDKIFGGAQVDIARTFVGASMKMPLTAYRMDMGDYPSTAEGLKALCTAPSGKADRWRGPYVTDGRIPDDPWKEAYQYRYPGQRNKSGYDLWSKGPDKQDGTADDIGNWASDTAEQK
ncbi:MAG: type II secretion system major pseudopilin GspG [Opitutaceae bacterium]